MAIRNVVLEGDEILRKKARPWENFDKKLAVLLDDMYETMKNSRGVGLAAPQVGILRRVAIVDAAREEDKKSLYELVNPKIIEADGEQVGREGCLSVPGELGIVKRPKHIKVLAFDRHGKEQIIEASDYFAVVLCHEIDHLDGVLYIDKAIEMIDPDDDFESDYEHYLD